jgi:hypothetical protein
MPDKETIERAHEDAREGKSPSTQAGEFVREEMHHVREGKHGVANTKQAIAIGLSKARKAGVDLPPPSDGSSEMRHKAEQESARAGRPTSPTRSRATSKALKRKGHRGASKQALARQGKSAAKRRPASARSSAAKRAARTRRRMGKRSSR